MKSFVPSLLLAELSLTIILTSCSVKEGRGQCPATLLLAIQGNDLVSGPVCVRTISPEGRAETRLLDPTLDGQTHRIPVSRRPFILAASNHSLDDGRWTIPEGEDCPEVYSCRRKIQVSDEEAFFEVRMQKDFCRMRISLSSPQEGLSMRLRGRFCGFTLEGTPLEGMFLSWVKEDWCCNVPRQGDNSLMLDIFSDSRKGIERSFALGEYLREAGYDWQERDLQDVSVLVDYVKSKAVISTAFWTYTISLDITL